MFGELEIFIQWMFGFVDVDLLAMDPGLEPPRRCSSVSSL